ncbi:hypothetical protein ACXR2U_03285 [Jatrophihabitans sp. YIM 134969]
MVARVQARWHSQLTVGQRSAVIAWASFATTFVGVRALTHWIRDGHGPSGGGVSVGGRHFHHYNIGIALLTGIGAVALRGRDRYRRHPATAIAYGAGTALIVDEAALLIDLQDVYWAREGRTSVDLAVGVIAVGGLALAGSSFWPAAVRELRPLRQRRAD